MGKTMHVPQDVLARIEKIIADGCKIAEAHYGKLITPPEIRYNKTGRTAGVAHTAKHEWYIDLNSVLLMEHLEVFIKRTPIHELAHMICEVVYPETLATRERKMTRTGRMKREKREIHGPRFYEVCDVLGMDNMSRLHSYDTTNSRKKTDTTIHAYKCLACDASINVTAKRHTMMLNGTRKYVCRKCSGPIAPVDRIKLKMIGNMPVVHVQQAAKPAAGKLGPVGDSKIAQCWALFKSYRTRYDRKTMITAFVHEADCTYAGAGTYYATCQKLHREGYI